MGIVLASAVVLSAALLAWQGEIGQRGVELVIAEVQRDALTGRFTAPPDTAHADMLSAWLERDDFQQQFALMRATTVFQRLPGLQVAFVLLNGARRAEWEPHAEALLAHEFGHAWIRAQGYPAPVFVPGPHSCLAIHTGDIVQHVLIRQELDRRGIEFRRHWLEGLEAAIPVMQTAAPPPEEDRCARARLAAEWIDVKLGVKPGEWAALERYEKAVRRYMPEIVSTVEGIAAWLRERDLTDRAVHRQALETVFERLKDLVYYRAKEFRAYGTLKKKRAHG
jgi:hypothetical protein